MSTPKPKKIRVVKGYGRYADQPLMTAAGAAVDGLEGNNDAPTPPGASSRSQGHHDHTRPVDRRQ